MAEPLDPSELDRRRRERDKKEAAEATAQREREAVEATDNGLLNGIVQRLKETGTSCLPDELAAELNDSDPEAVRRALERAVKAGTVTESHGRYSARTN